jgi:hypothetical protein
MFKFSDFLQSLLPSAEAMHERDERYLAEAVDIYDLERRMREIDARSHGQAPGLLLGLEGR